VFHAARQSCRVTSGCKYRMHELRNYENRYRPEADACAALCSREHVIVSSDRGNAVFRMG
jgi:hypothetical protein